MALKQYALGTGRDSSADNCRIRCNDIPQNFASCGASPSMCDLAKSDQPEPSGAKIIVSSGHDRYSGDNLTHLEPLADKLNAAISAAIDAGFVPNNWPVGQTDKCER